MAAPVPRSRGPETACTVTCTTPMTVPMNNAMTQNDHASCVGDISGARKAIATSPIVAAIKPQVGNTAVRPGLVTICPVNIEPIPMPAVSGSNTKPVSAGEAPRTARKKIGRERKRENRAAPWQAGIAAAPQNHGRPYKRRGGGGGGGNFFLRDQKR